MQEFKLIDPTDVTRFVDMMADAYPGIGISTRDQRDKFGDKIAAVQESSPHKYYGLFRNQELVGGMRLFDLCMNLRGHMIDVGGVGLVGVDFYHKKERIGKELITRYLEHYRAKGAPVAVLYAFRTDFYHQMGFGFGPKMHQYRLPPERFPTGPNKAHIRLLRKSDADALAACYARAVATTHGLMEKRSADWDALLAGDTMRVVGYADGDQIRGYLSFTFQPNKADHFGSNNMVVREFFYESPEVLSEFMTFLHSQADQIRFIIFNTQDDYFYHSITDARNDSEAFIPHVYHETNTSGVGLMYRVIDTPGVFRAVRDHNFNGQSCRVRFAVEDSFLPHNNHPVVVYFEDGVASVQPSDAPVDVELRISIANFSSLLMGVIPLKQQLKLGLAAVSDAAFVDVLHRMFYMEEGPVCTTGF